MICPAGPLPIQVINPDQDTTISDETAQVVASWLLDLVERQDQARGEEVERW